MSDITIWPQVKGRPPEFKPSLRGATIVMGAQAAKPVYFGQEIVLEGEEPERGSWLERMEREPTLAQEEADAECRAELRGEA